MSIYFYFIKNKQVLIRPQTSKVKMSKKNIHNINSHRIIETYGLKDLVFGDKKKQGNFDAEDMYNIILQLKKDKAKLVEEMRQNKVASTKFHEQEKKRLKEVIGFLKTNGIDDVWFQDPPKDMKTRIVKNLRMKVMQLLSELKIVKNELEESKRAAECVEVKERRTAEAEYINEITRLRVYIYIYIYIYIYVYIFILL
jgi:hypothetical protein